MGKPTLTDRLQSAQGALENAQRHLNLLYSLEVPEDLDKTLTSKIQEQELYVCVFQKKIKLIQLEIDNQ